MIDSILLHVMVGLGAGGAGAVGFTAWLHLHGGQVPPEQLVRTRVYAAVGMGILAAVIIWSLALIVTAFV